MYKGKKVSVVLPAFNEEKNIKNAVSEFKGIKEVDEIIVIDNNSVDKTNKIAKKAGARVIIEKKQGYGFALRRGISEAKGDLIVLSEPDGTFDANDLRKLLPLTLDFDVAMGTRTNKKYIKKGANMKNALRYGNIFIAKLIQIAYNLENLTDCGCTFRIFKKRLVNKISPYFSVGSSHFLPETVILAKLAGGKMIEIPISYRKRVGKSKITGSLVGSARVGMNMLATILKYKLDPPRF